MRNDCKEVADGFLKSWHKLDGYREYGRKLYRRNLRHGHDVTVCQCDLRPCVKCSVLDLEGAYWSVLHPSVFVSVSNCCPAQAATRIVNNYNYAFSS